MGAPLEAYERLMLRHSEEINSLGIYYAFGSKAEIEEQLIQKANVKSLDELEPVLWGGWMRKGESHKFYDALKRQAQELKQAILSTTASDGLAYQAFYYEIVNHECAYTGNYEDALRVLPVSWREIQNTPVLREAWSKAKKRAIAELDY